MYTNSSTKSCMNNSCNLYDMSGSDEGLSANTSAIHVWKQQVAEYIEKLIVGTTRLKIKQFRINSITPAYVALLKVIHLICWHNLPYYATIKKLGGTCICTFYVAMGQVQNGSLYIRYMYTYTVIWEMFVVKIFLCRAGEPGKLNTQIYTCIYNEHFVCLNFMVCHNPQKYSNRKILHTKKWHRMSHYM